MRRKVIQYRNTFRHFSVLTVFAVAFANVAIAEQFEILHAAYGTAHRNIDVTQRLQQLAGANATFRLSYRTFGDPAVGHAKSLRIFARGPRGVNRIFEYRDNDVVDGSMFTGWSGGQWNGGWNPGPGWTIGCPPIHHPGGGPIGGNPIGRLQILSAKYGAGNRQVDVTGRLQSPVNNGRISVQVNNGFMAVGDPAPSTPKNLFVSYSVGNGKRQTRTVGEDSVLTLP